MQEKDPSTPVTGCPAPNACPPPKQKNSCSRLNISIVVFVVTLGIIYIISPSSVPQTLMVQVDSLSLSNFSLSNSSITGNWNVRFSVTNPNQNMYVAYDDISPSIFYKNEFISETRLPPFNQQGRNWAVFDAAFSATDTYVDAWVVNDINGDRTRGTISFNIKVCAMVELTVRGLTVEKWLLRVFCEGVAVWVSANRTGSGNMVGGPRDCTADLQTP